MKTLAALPLLLAFGITALAEDSKPLLVSPGKVVAAPSLKEPLDAPWSVQKGT